MKKTTDCRNAVVGVGASLRRQPLVPLHRATALCGCLYASLHNDSVRPLSCILARLRLLCWFRIVRNLGQALSRILARPAKSGFSRQHQKSRAMPVCDSGSVAGRGVELRSLVVGASVHRQPLVPLHLCNDSH